MAYIVRPQCWYAVESKLTPPCAPVQHPSLPVIMGMLWHHIVPLPAWFRSRITIKFPVTWATCMLHQERKLSGQQTRCAINALFDASLHPQLSRQGCALICFQT